MIDWTKDVNRDSFWCCIEPFQLEVQRDPYNWWWSIGVNGRGVFGGGGYATPEEAQGECIVFLRKMAYNVLKET